MTGGIFGFTLIELTVVLIVIAVLASVLYSIASTGIAYARRLHCKFNLRQISMATHMYVQDNASYPPAWLNNNTRWMDMIKPYLEGENQSAAYICPCDDVRVRLPWDSQITMSYGINSFNFGGAKYCFWYVVEENNVARPGETILFADCTPGKYYCGGASKFKNPVKDVDYRHIGGTFNAAYCDGHVETKKATDKRDWDASQ